MATFNNSGIQERDKNRTKQKKDEKNKKETNRNRIVYLH